jgi:prevent-host-death family protein
MTLVTLGFLMVSKSKFKSRALHYFRAVEKTRKPLTITDRGRPVLKIVPYSEDPGTLLEELRNTVLRYENPTEPVGLDDWEALK